MPKSRSASRSEQCLDFVIVSTCSESTFVSLQWQYLSVLPSGIAEPVASALYRRYRHMSLYLVPVPAS